jgi:phosphohistidine phosphatase
LENQNATHPANHEGSEEKEKMRRTIAASLLLVLTFATETMATRDKQPPTAAAYTTNEEDQREAAKLQARLQEKRHASSSAGGPGQKLPSVEIASGAHKYVLIRAELDGEEQYIVCSRKGAHYHRNAAEPMIQKLENAGYDGIEVLGGGRILLDENARKISIFGYSYTFGQANHVIAQRVVQQDQRYKDFSVTISNEGY